jgi:alkanesulfonate monooxygenase SsuD/methylene tetrahydromethanopterin reductase-like flavin-dependent oxidoreductase (luciferase family)
VQIGLSLPNAVPGTAGKDLVTWAVETERAGFATLATLDRLVYDNYESLTTLAAAAAVTEQIRLRTAICLASNAVLVCSGAIRIAVISRICSVTAAAAASVVRLS